jgi:hypothetical protein
MNASASTLETSLKHPKHGASSLIVCTVKARSQTSRFDAGTILFTANAMIFNSIEYTVPEHWLSAIINGDETSFDYYDDAKDYEAYKAFCELEVSNATVEVVGEESYFDSFHDARGYGVLPCNVVDCIFHFPDTAQTELPTA